jgi:polysaccharide deacetylase 2 family uncharacterized protein YibQ
LQKNRLLLLLMAIAGLVVVGLVLLARVEERPPTLPPVSRQPTPPAAPSPAFDFEAGLQVEVEALLATLDLPADAVRRDLAAQPERYTVAAAPPSPALIAALTERVAALPGDLSVDEAGARLSFNRAGRPVLVVLFAPPVPPVPSGPLVTIIVDDMGRSTRRARQLLAIPQPVTLSILPIEDDAREIAELAHAAGREVMLHAPMEPQAYPAIDPGSDALLVRYEASEIRRRFDALLASLPYVIGTNNHMGSRFTEDAGALAPVMQSVAEKGLFFIDSRTTGRSKVPEVALRYGVPSMSRDLFLDNVAEPAAIGRELRRLLVKARRQGMAIGICHPYKETVATLQRQLPLLAREGVTFVPVSVLLRKQAELAASGQNSGG